MNFENSIYSVFKRKNMKKQILIFTCCIALFACNQAQPEIEQVEELTTTQDETPIVSLTDDEAKELIKKFLKDNDRMYKEYGEIEDLYLVGGNYNNDGALDYFYTVGFFPGGDFIYFTHFFYDSEQNKITELKMNKSIEFVSSIDVKEISLGKLIGEAYIWSAFSGEHMASRFVKAEFKLDGDKITCDEKYIPAFKKAQKEIQKELEKMEREMMEEADAFNSDDY